MGALRALGMTSTHSRLSRLGVPPLQPDAGLMELGEIQFSTNAIPAVPRTPAAYTGASDYSRRTDNADADLVRHN